MGLGRDFWRTPQLSCLPNPRSLLPQQPSSPPGQPGKWWQTMPPLATCRRKHQINRQIEILLKLSRNTRSNPPIRFWLVEQPTTSNPSTPYLLDHPKGRHRGLALQRPRCKELFASFCAKAHDEAALLQGFTHEPENWRRIKRVLEKKGREKNTA